MKYAITIPLMLFFALILSSSGNAQPDFNQAVTASGIVFYNDLTKRNVFYYLPGNLTIGKSAEGKPDFNFILMRYTGSSVYNDDEQRIHFRNILTMKLVMERVNPDSLRKARTILSRSNSSVQLRPMPISQIEAMLVFVPVGEADSSVVVKKGEMAAESNTGYATSASYWEERHFTVFLDNFSANLLLEALQKDLAALSFMYAFYAKGATEKKVLETSGHGKLSRVLQQQFANNTFSDDSTNEVRECIVKSDAFGIYIDTASYPDLIRKIDINDGVPPGYAMLNVRNYDFANNLRPDLYEKTVELEATGAGGNKINLSFIFSSKQHDITSANFRFKYAVRLDKPYRYRVRELLNTGQEIVSEWKSVDAWSNILDVTTRKSPSTINSH